MSKHIKTYLRVWTDTVMGEPQVIVSGHEFKSDKKRPHGNDVYLQMSTKETEWFIYTLQRAVWGGQDHKPGDKK